VLSGATLPSGELSERNHDTAFAFGVAATRTLNPASRAPSSVEVLFLTHKSSGGEDRGHDGEKLRVTEILLNGRLGYGIGDIILPYLKGGLGACVWNIEISGASTTTSKGSGTTLCLNAGGGVEIALSRETGEVTPFVSLEGIYTVLNLGDPVVGVEGSRFSVSYYNLVFGAGVRF
jgi:hypothetical protein